MDLMVDLLVVLFFPAVLAVLLSIAELRIKYAEKELLNKIKEHFFFRSALLLFIFYLFIFLHIDIHTGNSAFDAISGISFADVFQQVKIYIPVI